MPSSSPQEAKRGADELIRLKLVDGCHALEYAPEGPFVWTKARFRLRNPGTPSMILTLGYLGAQGRLSLSVDAQRIDETALREGWQRCTLTVPPGKDWIDLEVTPVIAVDGEPRELGIMLRTMTPLDDETIHAALRARTDNALLNDIEFRQGSSILASHPQHLRITVATRCNIPETSQPCAYCFWDWAKEMEKGAPDFRLDSLDDLRGFYTDAETINDCSIAEPIMNKHFAQVAARIDGDYKHFSFTTNGQLLGARQRRELLGKNVDVYVSIDAATAEGFRRYRNDRFDRIISNLRAFCLEKREHDNLPKVIVSLLAMRSNRDEIDAYLALMKDVGVDLVKLRALTLDDNVAPVVINNGYRFDYAAEVLDVNELARVGEAARISADEHDIPLYIEWEQFEAERAGQPRCGEPWKTLYVLNRGVMPCCYATDPIAKWEDQGDRTVDQFLTDTFNSPAYQDIRRELAAGRLSSYCRNTPSCPVLKRQATAAGCSKQAASGAAALASAHESG